MRTRKPYYQALGVPEDAPYDEVKRAYRALAKRLHPDRLRDPREAQAAEERLKEINAAWSDYLLVLKGGGDSVRRRGAHRTASARRAAPRRERSRDEGEIEDDDELFERARATDRRPGRTSRDRYRAERAHEARVREARERRAREQIEEVRRERARVEGERRVEEHDRMLGAFRILLFGASALVGLFVLLVVVLWALG